MALADGYRGDKRRMARVEEENEDADDGKDGGEGERRISRSGFRFPRWNAIANEHAPAYDLSFRASVFGAVVMAEYKVKFEVFEGPLDLLLYLIKKEEVDIYEVNLTKLATQFIEYIDTMRLLDLEVAGEFLVMASTLMYIKSRELLPVEQQVQVEGEDEGEDPRWELIRQLVEYKKFKDAAAQLQALEATQENTFPRLPIKPVFEEERAPMKAEVSIFDLLNAVNSVLQRFTKRDDARDIFEDKWTVSEKIEHVMKSISTRGKATFTELFAQAASRSEVVCTFLAILELIRLKQLVCMQAEPFAEIEITMSTAGQASSLSPTEPPEAAATEPVAVASSSGEAPEAASEQAGSKAESEVPTHGS